jgi:hypothetical protein
MGQCESLGRGHAREVVATARGIECEATGGSRREEIRFESETKTNRGEEWGAAFCEKENEMEREVRGGGKTEREN